MQFAGRLERLAPGLFRPGHVSCLARCHPARPSRHPMKDRLQPRAARPLPPIPSVHLQSLRSDAANLALSPTGVTGNAKAPFPC